MGVPKNGYVCVWSIKNPENPERTYRYNMPVVSVEFSPFESKLLAIGLYDGRVEVRDITNRDDPPLAVSLHQAFGGCDPIMCIRWFKQPDAEDSKDLDPFIALSQDGSVTRYRIIRSPYLVSFPQMLLQRIEGTPEGFQIPRHRGLLQQSNRHPQGLGLTMHPLNPDLYYILTDEGCLHKCSTNYTHQYLEVLRTHNGSVNSMDFSPWSPKVFLTCGNDWTIRIWIEGIFKPVLSLKNRYIPINVAYWSRTHSTVIIAVCRKSMDVWDIRTNILHSMSSTQLGSSFHTTARLSRDGTCIAMGNERGNFVVSAFDNFPFQPHFQFESLEQAIWKANVTDDDMLTEIKNVGYYGYPKGGYTVSKY